MSLEQVVGVLRAILAAIGGFILAKGWVNAENFATISGVVITLVTAAWSIFSKRPASIVVQAQAIRGVDVEAKPTASPAVKTAIADAKAAG